MKKRLISMLLAVLLVATMFGGTSISAYADSDYNTFKYTIVSGDTLLQICNNSGLNFYTCQTAINKLNNFTSEAQYRKLYVGQVITLPASNEDAAKIASSYVSGGTGSSTGSTSGSTGNVSGNVAYWLIPYTIQSGETITGVCNTLGISFSSYADLIKSINNISSWNRIPAGKTLLLPTAVKPAAGISCYAVMAHKVTQGETTYGICQNYGISYTSNTSLLQTLNPKVSLTNIKYNTTLLVPVPTVITAGGSNNGGSTSGGNNNGGSTSGGSNNGGSTSGGGNTGSSTKTYAIKSSTSGGGSLSFTVNGKTATAAAAGATVTIKANPNSYKTLDSIKVTTSDKSAVISVNNGSFTMPESDVQVTATFNDGYLVGKGYWGDGSGSLTCTVNNIPVDFAVKGATVKVTATPDAGSTFAGINVVNAAGNPIYTGLKNGDTFTMPGEKVFVRVYFNAAATYSFTKEATTNGSFSLQVLGSEVSRAAAGATVKVVTKPNTGYAVESITVTNDSNGQVMNYNNSDTFTMPASNVTVKVTYKLSTVSYKVSVNNSVEGGTATAQLSGDNKTIILNASPYAGYVLDHYVLEYSGIQITVANAGDNTTAPMPNADVTVTPVFRPYNTMLALVNPDATYAKVSFTDASGNAIEPNQAGNVKVFDNVNVSVTTPDDGYAVTFTVTDGSGKVITTTNNKSFSFAVPATNRVTVSVSFTNVEHTLTIEPNWRGDYNLKINGTFTQINSDTTSIKVPSDATVEIVLRDGFDRNTYEYSRYILNGTAGAEGSNKFTMPRANATLSVEIVRATQQENLAETSGETSDGFNLG